MEKNLTIHGHSARLVDGEVYISSTGHLHRSPQIKGYRRSQKFKLHKGILFDGLTSLDRNNLTEKLQSVVQEFDGKLINFSARHYVREADNGFRLHRHGQYDADRTKINNYAVILFADTSDKMDAILERLVPTEKKKKAAPKKKSTVAKAKDGAKKVVKKTVKKVKAAAEKVEEAVKPKKKTTAKATAKKSPAKPKATKTSKAKEISEVPSTVPETKPTKKVAKPAAKKTSTAKASTTKAKTSKPTKTEKSATKKPVTKKKKASVKA